MANNNEKLNLIFFASSPTKKINEKGNILIISMSIKALKELGIKGPTAMPSVM